MDINYLSIITTTCYPDIPTLCRGMNIVGLSHQICFTTHCVGYVSPYTPLKSKEYIINLFELQYLFGPSLTLYVNDIVYLYMPCDSSFTFMITCANIDKDKDNDKDTLYFIYVCFNREQKSG